MEMSLWGKPEEAGTLPRLAKLANPGFGVAMHRLNAERPNGESAAALAALEVRLPLFQEGADAFFIVMAVVDPAAQVLHPLEGLRAQDV